MVSNDGAWRHSIVKYLRQPSLTAIHAPSGCAPQEGSPEAALVEIARGRLEGEGPVTQAALADALGLEPQDIGAALMTLETEGFALRGRFTPGAAVDEWCERGLLARIHRYTVKRLRAEIEPVAARDFLRFLFDWQRVAADARMQGPEAVGGLVRQLEGFEAPAGAWETEILPARLVEYEPSWLDDHCLVGHVTWARLRPRNGGANGERKVAPVRSTPITLLERRHAQLWGSLPAAADPAPLTAPARAVADFLRENGASFFEELVDGTRLLRTEARAPRIVSRTARASRVDNGLPLASSFLVAASSAEPRDLRALRLCAAGSVARGALVEIARGRLEGQGPVMTFTPMSRSGPCGGLGGSPQGDGRRPACEARRSRGPDHPNRGDDRGLAKPNERRRS